MSYKKKKKNLQLIIIEDKSKLIYLESNEISIYLKHDIIV